MRRIFNNRWMRILITGLNGTLAPHLASLARARSHEVVGWDRDAVSPDDASAGDAFLRNTQPDAIAHLGFGSEDWSARLATWAAANDRSFVFTSTAMVFDHMPDGPHHVNDERTAKDDYGRYKIRCEDAIRAANPRACIARIGWQIDIDDEGKARGNNMLAALDQQQASDGRIRASTAWRPACSFMGDTALALLQLIEQRSEGVVHLDSNADSALNFYGLVTSLKVRFARASWIIEPHAEYVHDQRLIAAESSAVRIAPLSARLGSQ
ncbi:MAG: NAD-dependent epimerase/dehydratase family protein [Burkholderiales bacterium]|nr:MAG: NAD-dependent epimerase/dehydratase family protein [Betaproteobacteria bacterium]TAG81281.1 MAG: NAD-dependent epimerase/dehydratase family protein [Burkholderiales bacterium]